MNYTIYSATGCARCKIVKQYMEERGINFVDKDMKADGKEDFRKFYASNRPAIYRGQDGIEFPIITDGQEIRQGIAVSLSWLSARSNLDGFFRIGQLHGEWVDGIDVSGGNPEFADQFIDVLHYLKGKFLKIQLETNGGNPSVLERALEGKLADRVIVTIPGPLHLYMRIIGESIDPEDVRKTISLATQFPEYRFETTIIPVFRSENGDSDPNFLTPEEVAKAARFIKESSGGNKHPFLIKPFRPEYCQDDRLKSIEPKASGELFKYRTAARAHLVLTEIEKPA